MPLSKENTCAALDFKIVLFSFVLANVTTAPVPLAIPSFTCVNTTPNPLFLKPAATASSMLKDSTAFTSGLIAWFQLYAPGLFERNCPGAPKLNPAAPRFGVFAP